MSKTPEQKAAHAKYMNTYRRQNPAKKEAHNKHRREKSKTPEARAKRAAYAREYRKRFPDKVRETEKISRDRHRTDPELREAFIERTRAEGARYRDKHREAKNARHAEWKRRNADKLRTYEREYGKKTTGERQIRADPERIFMQIMKLLPRGLPPHIRDDVAGTVCLAILERHVRHDRMAEAVKDALRKHNREFDHFKTLSLDAPVPGMDGATYLDRLAASD